MGVLLEELLQVSGWPLTARPATVVMLPAVSILRTQLLSVSERNWLPLESKAM